MKNRYIFKLHKRINVNGVNKMNAPNIWEGVKFNVRNKKMILRKDIYDYKTGKFLHSPATGLFMPVRKVSLPIGRRLR
jgi:hypothetical protein